MARFTAANARENAAKSHATRRQRLASGNLAGETFPQTPQVGPHELLDSYLSRRLSRVREQLDRLDAMLLTEKDAQKIDRLASAQLRLSEQERILAGRPLPGSRRPKEEPDKSKPKWEDMPPPEYALLPGPPPEANTQPPTTTDAQPATKPPTEPERKYPYYSADNPPTPQPPPPAPPRPPNPSPIFEFHPSVGPPPPSRR